MYLRVIYPVHCLCSIYAICSIISMSPHSAFAAEPRLFSSLDWGDPNARLHQYGSSLRLKSQSEGSHRLLIRLDDHEVVYEYDPDTNRLDRASEKAWEEADDPVAECGNELPPPATVLTIDPRSNQLVAKRRTISAAGKTILRLLASPSGDKVAVLSAEGEKGTSMLPFLGSGGASGTHFHQTFSLPDLVQVGVPQRLPMGSGTDDLQICWSADERYIVYTDAIYSRLTVLFRGR